MVIDTSAIAAIFVNEPDAPNCRGRIVDDPIRLISAATLVEAAMVIEGRFGEADGAEPDLWLHKANVEVVAVTTEHADQARQAWHPYGKGRRPAKLNYGDGDGFAYAPAALTGKPLLFKRNDFSQTDIPVVGS